jgi:hypothetical protein
LPCKAHGGQNLVGSLAENSTSARLFRQAFTT